MSIEFTNLIIIVVIVVAAWFLLRQLVGAISCGIRALLFIVVAVAVLYVVGSAMGWPIINFVNGLML